MNLLDLYEQREPYQQNIDELEYRRMNDLRDKMQYLLQAYRQATTDDAKNAIMARYNEYKAEREGYMKVREQQVPSRQDAFAYVKPEPKGIGDVQDPRDKMAQLAQRGKKGPLANVAAGIKAFVQGKPEPMDEQTAPQSHAVGVYYEILKAWEDERDYIVIPFPDGRSATMIRGQIWNAIVTFNNIKDNKRRAKYVQQHLDTFDTFMPWLSSLQRYKVPAKRRVKQQSLDLQPKAVTPPDAVTQTAEPAISTDVKLPNLQEKKKSNDLDATDVRLSRELQTARARFPGASSDLEAGILDQMERQDQAQQALAQQQSDINRQDQQVVALTQANQAQSAQIRTQGQEIDRLTQRVQQTVPTVTPVAPSTTGTAGVATMSTPPTARPDVIYVPDVPADTATQDREIARLNKQIQQLELMMTLKTPAERSDIEDRVRALEKARDEQEAKKQKAAEKAKAAAQAKKNALTVDMSPAQAQRQLGFNQTPAQAQGQLGLSNDNDLVGVNLDPQDQAAATAASKEAGKAIKKAQRRKVATTATALPEGQMKSQDTLRRELAQYGAKKFGQIYGMTADEVNRIKSPNPAQDTPMAAPRFRDAQGQAQLETKIDSGGLRQQLAMKYRELAPAITPGRDTYLAGQLYDALEDIAQQHGAMSEFRKIMDNARNRAHMEYDTNPGGFHNWFQFLPFSDDEDVLEAVKEPTTRRELLDRIDRIQRMMTQNPDTANVQRMKKDIELLKQRYQHLKEDLGNEAVEIAIMRRILIQHTDLIQAHGLDRVVAAIEDVAAYVGEVDEIGSSDVSAYVRSVMQDLEPDADDLLREKKWSARYKSSINCGNPKGFSQKAHCAGKQK